MLKVVTGRFHPCLESAFVEQIQRLKAADLWARIAILAPSKPILDRIRRLLAIEHGLSLLNVHLLTFHQLALRLAQEQYRHRPHPPLRIVDDLFFEQLLRHVAEQRIHDSPALRQLGRSFGTWAALWSSIRDLNDGEVDPATALQALAEGCFGQDDQAWLHALFSLQAAVQHISTELRVGTADDLADKLVAALPESSFVASLSHVCYYGFYDLTQVQLSLFQAVSANTPTTLFFPMGKDPCFAFARRFFDRHIQPMLGSDSRVDLDGGTSDVPEIEQSVHNVIGPEEELSVTCRAILDLVETHGYRFHEIGVVARTLDPYRSAIQTIFERHRIPSTTTARRPLVQQPLCKTLLQLAVLPLHDFYRSDVLDLVTSPFYAASFVHDPGRLSSYRPEQWRAVVEALNITHGLDEWRRLKRSCQSALKGEDAGDDETGAIGPLELEPDVVALLWKTVSDLLASYADLPARGPYGTLLQAFERLAEKHLCRPEVHEEVATGQTAPLAVVWEAIDQAMTSLRELAAIGQELSWAEFTELLTHAFERASVALEPASPQGVMVMDAMAARGLPFKALFVLGLNEKVFPRYIREDPFLRDRHRRVLETTLGYKVDEKLPAYDEEALLFTLLRQAAGRRLYLSFQRADDAGRALAPSPYVVEAMQSRGMPAQPARVVPRRLAERIAQRPMMIRFFPPSDLAQWMAAEGKDLGHLLEATGQDGVMYRHGVEALSRTENQQPALTAFDGLTGPLDSHWAAVLRRGIAPTPLERYARCPFRYFSADVLRLEPVRTQASYQPDARVLGTFCHGALRRCFEMLLPTGWPEKPVTENTIDWCIETAVEEAARPLEQEHRTGHYLLWELAKTRIVDVMTAAIDEETRAYRHAPFTPVAFEVAAEGTIADIAGCGSAPLKIRGRIDRVDRHRDSGALRIIDYKLKMGQAMTAEDRDLAQSALRGYRLQPPLYAQLHVPDHGIPRQVQLLFLAPYWSRPVARSTFESAVWSGDTGQLLRETLGRLISGIRDGRFFILPDTYCRACEYRVACRREHMPTWWRASRAVESKKLTALRMLQVPS
jgi:ATP-dependent helicase/nuclease subunit B